MGQEQTGSGTTSAGAQINDGGPAFPRPATLQESFIYAHEQDGMTLRDYFAGQAMTGCLPGSMTEIPPEEYAKWAYRMADAMLAARGGAQ